MPPSRVSITGLPEIITLSPGAQFPAVQQGVTGRANVGQILSMVSAAGGGPPFVLPAATTATLGGIIVGSGLSVTPQGVLSTASASAYVLPPATGTTLGGIIVGGGLSISPLGLLSATGTGGGSGTLNNQWTAAQVATLVIDGSISIIQTTGYYTAGDGGDAYYIRVGSQPSYPGYIRDLSGAFFALFTSPVSLRSVGAHGDGVLNSVTGAYTGTNDVNFVLNWLLTAVALNVVAYANAGNYLIGTLASFSAFTGTYDNTTGVITLTSSGTTTAIPGAWVKLTGLTGTGAVASLGGANTHWKALAGTGGNTTVLQGPVGVGAATIASGTATIQAGVEIAVANGLTIEGDGAGTVFVHQLPRDQMFWFGDDARFNNVNFVIPADADIVTTSDARKGTTTLALNTLAIAGISQNLQANEYVAIIDPTVNIPYHIGVILPITAVSVGTTTIFTFTGTNNFEVGDLVFISGTTGTISAINNDSYNCLAVGAQTVTLDVDTSGLVWSGGGQVGTGGLAGHPSQTARVRSITGTTITLDESLEFDYTTGTQIGVWYNPTVGLTLRNFNVAFDPTKARNGGVAAAIRCDSCIDTRIENITFLNATTRCLTLEDSLWGTISGVTTHTWKDNSPTHGFQGATSHWIVSDCLQYGGAHIVQVGSNPDQVGTNYIKMVGCHAISGGQMGDTHWNARMVSFVGCTCGTTTRAYVGTTNLDAGFTVRGYMGIEIRNCSTFNRAVGFRMHCGTDGSLIGCKAEGCNYGLYINQWDNALVEGNEFKNINLYGIYHLSTVGPTQNFPTQTNLRFKNNTFIGDPPEGFIADYYLSLAQQDPEQLAGNGWQWDNNGAVGRPTIYKSNTSMFDDGYQPSPATDVAVQAFGPFFSMSPTTGATVSVPDVSAVTTTYGVNDLIVYAGGAGGTIRTITNIAQSASAQVTTSAGHGFNTGDSVWIFGVGGMTQVNNMTFAGITKVDTTNFNLNVDSTGFTAYSGGGSVATSPTVPAESIVQTIQLVGGTIHAAGINYADGDTITLTGGTSSTKAVLSVLTDGAGHVTSFTVTNKGNYTATTTTYTQFSTSGSGTGFQLQNAIFGPLGLAQTAAGRYTATPPNPAAQASTTGTGTGAAYALTFETMLNLAASPKVDVDASVSGETITSMGPSIGGQRRRIRFNGASTIVNSTALSMPNGLNVTTANGTILDFDADPPVGWVCSSPGGSNILVQQTAFPTPPPAGALLEWADDTGRIWRMDSAGRSRGFVSETTRFIQLEALNSSTAFSGLGGDITPTAGTAVAVAITPTNAYTRQTRQYVASSAAIHMSANYEASPIIYMNDSNRVTLRFGWEKGNVGSTLFAGIKPSGDPGTSSPIAFLNAIGVGATNVQSTLRYIHNDNAGTRVATDLGANFPAFTTATTFYEVDQWWGTSAVSATSVAKIWYQVVALGGVSAIVATGTYTSSIPSLNSALVAGVWSNTVALTSASNQLALMMLTMEPR